MGLDEVAIRRSGVASRYGPSAQYLPFHFAVSPKTASKASAVTSSFAPILQPRTPPAPPQPWADLPKVLDLARRKNAVIKVSGACTLSREPYPFPDIWDPLARVFDAWGFDRCLWGTDWTRAYAVVNYEQAVVPFLKTDRLSESERAMLMGGPCAKAYRWSPKKG
jgi:L-fuconolactonase